MSEAEAALRRLMARDAQLQREGVRRGTLAPDRRIARSLEALGRALLPRLHELPGGTATAWSEGLVATTVAIRTHFPDNVLWDLDHLAASVLRDASDDPSAAAERVQTAFAEVLELHALFGCGSPIRFRYVHDFAYGFDWAKWVRRDAAARSGVGPFDLAFLRSLRQRGHELLALIEQDDEVYPRLRTRGARNPFAFSREPEEELSLYRDLAAQGLIPVRAWTFDEPPVWDRSFAEEREARARALGLLRGQATKSV